MLLSPMMVTVGLVVYSQDRNITVKFLHPHIPATSFFYPQHEDILEVDPLDILTIVHPITATGRTYNITRNEMLEASSALESYLSCLILYALLLS